MGYAMTGQEHSNKSEFLKKIGDIELPLFKRKNLSGKKGKRNMASSTARNATSSTTRNTTSSTTTSGGGY
jgi:transcriptional regulator of met regulon